MQIILIAAQIVVLLVIGVLLWQIWRFPNRSDIPDDEPLGEKRAKDLTIRLTWLWVCFVLEATLLVASAVLRVLKII